MKTSILLQVVLTVGLAASFPAASPHAVENNRLERRAVVQKRGWNINFLDDFSGSSFMSSATAAASTNGKWIVDSGTSYPGGPAQWGNGESESYTTSTSSLSISPSGTLLITPQKVNGKWTSGRIETSQSNFVCAAGKAMYIEGRFKVGNASAAYQQGIWPAFWSLGTAFRTNKYAGWPAIGEWDFFESINGLSKMYTTVHCGTAPGGVCNEFNGIGNGGSTAFSRGVFHEVGFMVDRTSNNWQTESLTWYLDDQAVYSITGAKLGDQATWNALAHTPHFLLLNVAVGGSFPNAVAGQATPSVATIGGTSVGMEIDYVVVYNSA